MDTKTFNTIADTFFRAVEDKRIHPALDEGCQVAAEEYLAMFVAGNYGDATTLINHCRSILIAKNGEYATDSDKLHNFKAAVAAIHETPLSRTLLQTSVSQARTDEIAFFYALKHATSVRDICDGVRTASPAMALEKFGDVINYCCIISALRAEEAVI